MWHCYELNVLRSFNVYLFHKSASLLLWYEASTEREGNNILPFVLYQIVRIKIQTSSVTYYYKKCNTRNYAIKHKTDMTLMTDSITNQPPPVWSQSLKSLNVHFVVFSSERNHLVVKETPYFLKRDFGLLIVFEQKTTSTPRPSWWPKWQGAFWLNTWALTWCQVKSLTRQSSCMLSIN